MQSRLIASLLGSSGAPSCAPPAAVTAAAMRECGSREGHRQSRDATDGFMPTLCRAWFFRVLAHSDLLNRLAFPSDWCCIATAQTRNVLPRWLDARVFTQVLLFVSFVQQPCCKAAEELQCVWCSRLLVSKKTFRVHPKALQVVCLFCCRLERLF